MSDAKLYGAVAQAAVLEPMQRARLFGAVANVAVRDNYTKASLFGAVANVAVLDTHTKASLFGAVAQAAVLQPTAVSGPDGISKIINISKDNIGSILGISYGDIDKINDID